MKQDLLTTTFVLVLAGLGMATASDLPPSKQSSLGLYLSSREAAGLLSAEPSALMIDVRTPEEIDETGIAEDVDALIPLALLNGSNGLAFNPDFYPGFLRLVSERNIATDTPIVLICRSGNRSAQAVNALASLGFTRVYTVTDGFEGDRAKDGRRTVNGWKNAGLPWRKQRASDCAPAIEGGAC
ncbi:rhodanese-like domain-containing protein [Tropicimonas marinistellae]|uniref:rhodanese-like domain-containing protein n=1 Tax=Tropicimonas marinistellae TaxID=1739787 RepID=UPI00082A5AB1|nr:rhodanese-like domain-containing protein [Tropicimonas marinistellae]